MNETFTPHPYKYWIAYYHGQPFEEASALVRQHIKTKSVRLNSTMNGKTPSLKGNGDGLNEWVHIVVDYTPLKPITASTVRVFWPNLID